MSWLGECFDMPKDDPIQKVHLFLDKCQAAPIIGVVPACIKLILAILQIMVMSLGFVVLVPMKLFGVGPDLRTYIFYFMYGFVCAGYAFLCIVSLSIIGCTVELSKKYMN